MSSHDLNAVFYSATYHPIQAGSIDGTDTLPHDNAVYRAVIASSTGLYDPLGDTKAQGDPHCIVFVGRLSRETTEKTLSEAMSKYGRIKNLRLIRHIVTGASQGYAFVEYETQKEMRHAFESAHHITIDGAEILVDYNRQMLMPGWIPRRLGGGLGGRKESGQLRFGGRDRPFRKPLRPIPEKELEKLGIPLPGNYMPRWQLPPLPKRPSRRSDDRPTILEHPRKSSERASEKMNTKDFQFQEDGRRKWYDYTEDGDKRREGRRDNDHRDPSVRYDEDDYKRQHHSRRSSNQEQGSSDWSKYQATDQEKHGSRSHHEQEHSRHGKRPHVSHGDIDDDDRRYAEKHERKKPYIEDDRHGKRYDEKQHHHRKRDRCGLEEEVRDHRTRHREEEDMEHHHHKARQDDPHYDQERYYRESSREHSKQDKRRQDDLHYDQDRVFSREYVRQDKRSQDDPHYDQERYYREYSREHNKQDKKRQDDPHYDQEGYYRESSREYSRQDKRRRVESMPDNASPEIQGEKYKNKWSSREPSLENRWNPPSEAEHLDI